MRYSFKDNWSIFRKWPCLIAGHHHHHRRHHFIIPRWVTKPSILLLVLGCWKKKNQRGLTGSNYCSFGPNQVKKLPKDIFFEIKTWYWVSGCNLRGQIWNWIKATSLILTHKNFGIMVDKIFVISAQKNLESYELIRLCSCYLCLCSCCLCLCLCVDGMQFVRNVGFHLSGHCVHHRPEQVSFPCLANGQIKFDQPRIIQHSFLKNVFFLFWFPRNIK